MADDRPCIVEDCPRQAAPRRLLCATHRTAEYRMNNPDYHRSYQQMSARRVKSEVVALYGGSCTCCGESHLAFLTMDHTQNDGGGRKRKQLSRDRWQEAKRRYGDGYYALLCFNCNTGRYINGGTCPHEEERH